MYCYFHIRVLGAGEGFPGLKPTEMISASQGGG